MIKLLRRFLKRLKRQLVLKGRESSIHQMPSVMEAHRHHWDTLVSIERARRERELDEGHRARMMALDRYDRKLRKVTAEYRRRLKGGDS